MRQIPVRNFQLEAKKYIKSRLPIALTRHGEVVAIVIHPSTILPTKPKYGKRGRPRTGAVPINDLSTTCKYPNCVKPATGNGLMFDQSTGGMVAAMMCEEHIIESLKRH